MATKFFEWTFNPTGTVTHFAGSNGNRRTIGYLYGDEVPGANGDNIGAQIVSIEMLSGQVWRLNGGDDDIDVRYDILMNSAPSGGSFTSSGRTSSTPPSSSAYGHYVQLPQDGSTTILDPAQGEGDYMAFPWITTPRNSSWFHNTETFAAIRLDALQYYANNMGGDDDSAVHGAYVFRIGYIPTSVTIPGDGVFISLPSTVQGDALTTYADVFGQANIAASNATIEAVAQKIIKATGSLEAKPQSTFTKNFIRSDAPWVSSAGLVADNGIGSEYRLYYRAYALANTVDELPGEDFSRFEVDVSNWNAGQDIFFTFGRTYTRPDNYRTDNDTDLRQGDRLNTYDIEFRDASDVVLHRPISLSAADEIVETNDFGAQGFGNASNWGWKKREYVIPNSVLQAYPTTAKVCFSIYAHTYYVDVNSRSEMAIYDPVLGYQYGPVKGFGGINGDPGSAAPHYGDVVGFEQGIEAVGDYEWKPAARANANDWDAHPDGLASTWDPPGWMNVRSGWDTRFLVGSSDLTTLNYQVNRQTSGTNNRYEHLITLQGTSTVPGGGEILFSKDLTVGVEVQPGDYLHGKFAFYADGRRSTYVATIPSLGADQALAERCLPTRTFTTDGVRTWRMAQVPDDASFVRVGWIAEQIFSSDITFEWVVGGYYGNDPANADLGPYGRYMPQDSTSTFYQDGDTVIWALTKRETIPRSLGEALLTELEGVQGAGVLLAGTGFLIGDATRLLFGTGNLMAKGAYTLGTAGFILAGIGTLIAVAATGVLAWGSAYRARRAVRQTTKLGASNATTDGSGTVS